MRCPACGSVDLWFDYPSAGCNSCTWMRTGGFRAIVLSQMESANYKCGADTGCNGGKASSDSAPEAIREATSMHTTGARS